MAHPTIPPPFNINPNSEQAVRDLPLCESCECDEVEVDSQDLKYSKDRLTLLNDSYG